MICIIFSIEENVLNEDINIRAPFVRYNSPKQLRAWWKTVTDAASKFDKCISVDNIPFLFRNVQARQFDNLFTARIRIYSWNRLKYASSLVIYCSLDGNNFYNCIVLIMQIEGGFRRESANEEG